MWIEAVKRATPLEPPFHTHSATPPPLRTTSPTPVAHERRSATASIRLDLPEPFGPIRTFNSPSGISDVSGPNESRSLGEMDRRSGEGGSGVGLSLCAGSTRAFICETLTVPTPFWRHPQCCRLSHIARIKELPQSASRAICEWSHHNKSRPNSAARLDCVDCTTARLPRWIPMNSTRRTIAGIATAPPNTAIPKWPGLRWT